MTRQRTQMARLTRLMVAAWILLAIAIGGGPLNAQTRGQKKPAPVAPAEAPPAEHAAKGEKVLTQQQQRAIYLLEQLLEKSRDFDNEGLKIRIRARVADALWDYDAARARQMFEDAFRAIDAAWPPAQAGQKAASATIPPWTQLRNEIIRLISARDSELADKLIKAVADVSPKPGEDPLSFNNADARASLYLQSAKLLVNTDPRRASQMLRMSIDSGLMADELIEALDIFRRKDPSLSDDLFRYALLKAKSSSQQPALKIIYLAAYVFPDFGGFGGPATGADAGPPNPALVAEILNSAYSVFMQADGQAQAVSSDQKIDEASQIEYWGLQTLLPYYDRYMPDKGLALRSQLKRAASKFPVKQLDMIDMFTRSSVVQDMLSRALTAPDSEKDDLYVGAAFMALQKGDFDQSLSIVKNIKDADRKSALETAARVQAVTDSISKEDYEAAYRYAKDVPRLQQRIFAFSQLSSALFDKKDRPRALEVLSDAEALTSKAGDGPDKARAMLTLAGAVARIDAIRGVEVMKSAVNAINHTNLTLTPAGVLTIVGTRAGPLNTFNFNDAFTPLAHSDFEGALLLAQTIERKEASALAQLAICRAALTRPPADIKGQEEKALQPPAPAKDEEPASKGKDKDPAGKGKKKPVTPESKP